MEDNCSETLDFTFNDAEKEGLLKESEQVWAEQDALRKMVETQTAELQNASTKLDALHKTVAMQAAELKKAAIERDSLRKMVETQAIEPQKAATNQPNIVTPPRIKFVRRYIVGTISNTNQNKVMEKNSKN